jgi:hypothetical protein
VPAGIFGVLQTAIDRAAHLGLDRTVNGVVAFISGLISVGLSRYEPFAAQWIMIILGGAAMLIGVVSYALGMVKPTPVFGSRKAAAKPKQTAKVTDSQGNH